jgi:hypothetical protein
MKRNLFGIISFAMMCVSSTANASESSVFGAQFDISTPAGTALGLVLRAPPVPWFKLGLDATYSLSPGVRANLLIDPIKFGIAPVANIDVGHQFAFKIPEIHNSPATDFNYVDLQGGLAFGKSDGFRFLMMAGMTYLDGTAHHFQGLLPSTNGLIVGDPNFKGWIPNVKIGFAVMF